LRSSFSQLETPPPLRLCPAALHTPDAQSYRDCSALFQFFFPPRIHFMRSLLPLITVLPFFCFRRACRLGHVYPYEPFQSSLPFLFLYKLFFGIFLPYPQTFHPFQAGTFPPRKRTMGDLAAFVRLHLSSCPSTGARYFGRASLKPSSADQTGHRLHFPFHLPLSRIWSPETRYLYTRRRLKYCGSGFHLLEAPFPRSLVAFFNQRKLWVRPQAGSCGSPLQMDFPSRRTFVGTDSRALSLPGNGVWRRQVYRRPGQRISSFALFFVVALAVLPWASLPPPHFLFPLRDLAASPERCFDRFWTSLSSAPFSDTLSYHSLLRPTGLWAFQFYLR